MGGPGSASFASVVIPDRSVAEIQAAAQQVFTEAGYYGGASSSGQMVFEREATRGTTVARQGFFAAQGGARTVERVRVDIVGIGAGSHRLHCQGYMVSNAGDTFFEDEQRLANVRNVSYQGLLNAIAKRLNSPQSN